MIPSVIRIPITGFMSAYWFVVYLHYSGLLRLSSNEFYFLRNSVVQSLIICMSRGSMLMITPDVKDF